MIRYSCISAVLIISAWFDNKEKQLFLSEFHLSNFRKIFPLNCSRLLFLNYSFPTPSLCPVSMFSRLTTRYVSSLLSPFPISASFLTWLYIQILSASLTTSLATLSIPRPPDPFYYKLLHLILRHSFPLHLKVDSLSIRAPPARTDPLCPPLHHHYRT